LDIAFLILDCDDKWLKICVLLVQDEGKVTFGRIDCDREGVEFLSLCCSEFHGTSQYCVAELSYNIKYDVRISLQKN